MKSLTIRNSSFDSLGDSSQPKKEETISKYELLNISINSTLEFFRGSNKTRATIAPNTLKEIQATKFTTTSTFTLMIFLIILVPFVAVGIGLYLTRPYLRIGCMGCFLSVPETTFYVIFSTILLFIGLSAAYKLRNEPDPLYFIPEFLLNWFGAGIGGFLGLFGQLFFPDPMYNQLLFSWDEFILFGLIIQHFVSCPLMVIIARKVQKTNILKIQRKSIQPESHLKTILKSPDLNELFLKFLESEFNADQFKFLIIVDIWKESFNENESFIQKQAQIIHDNFTSINALFAVNIASSVRERICEKFDKKDTIPIKIEVFDEAYLEVSKLLGFDSLSR